MAKKVVATLKTAGTGKSFTKCIKMVKSGQTGSYVFKEEIIQNENIQDFFAKK
jgi:ABC-type histidine transport system ATPase subunit